MRSPSRSVLVVAVALASTAALAQPALAGHRKPTTSGTATPVSSSAPLRVVASTTSVTDSTLHTFKPDAPYAVGGSLATSGHPVAHTYTQPLYQHSRTGLSGYDIPVSTPGTYFVDLFVSETGGAQPGQRVWDVTADGRTVVRSVDVVRDAGPDTAWHVLFATPVTDGVLNLRFVRVAGLPVVDALEVDFQKSATATSTLFSDDFDGAAGTAPSASRWSDDTGGNGWGNNELESYTNRTDNAALDGAGNLSITARKETYTGSDGITRDYTSARLTTRNTFSFQYGTAEARVRIPGGQGLWPAFWLLGSNIGSVGWPVCGEMDVMENIGSEPATTHATIHAGVSDATGQWLYGAGTNTADPLSAAYHTYGLVWGPTAVSMSLDGRTYMTESVSDIAPTWWWGFGHPFFLILDLAVGGSWPGYPDATTPFPAVMSVDYVHVTG